MVRIGRIGVAVATVCVALPVPSQAAQQTMAAPESAAPVPTARDVASADPVRKVLLDSLRPVVERDLGQPVIFVVDALRVQGRWAFATVHPRTPAGWAIDFRLTRHAARMEAGILDGDTIYALMRRNGPRWMVQDYVIGPTDVAYAAWPEEFGAPPGLMGLPVAQK
jgi:hypothetical protein